MGDERLVRQAQCGVSKALEELCRREWRPVYALLYATLRDRQESEDATQEVFASVLGALPLLPPKMSKPVPTTCLPTGHVAVTCLGEMEFSALSAWIRWRPLTPGGPCGPGDGWLSASRGSCPRRSAGS
jgi:hypothetical protein